MFLKGKMQKQHLVLDLSTHSATHGPVKHSGLCFCLFSLSHRAAQSKILGAPAEFESRGLHRHYVLSGLRQLLNGKWTERGLIWKVSLV